MNPIRLATEISDKSLSELANSFANAQQQQVSKDQQSQNIFKALASLVYSEPISELSKKLDSLRKIENEYQRVSEVPRSSSEQELREYQFKAVALQESLLASKIDITEYIERQISSIKNTDQRTALTQSVKELKTAYSLASKDFRIKKERIFAEADILTKLTGGQAVTPQRPEPGLGKPEAREELELAIEKWGVEVEAFTKILRDKKNPFDGTPLDANEQRALQIQLAECSYHLLLNQLSLLRDDLSKSPSNEALRAQVSDKTKEVANAKAKLDFMKEERRLLGNQNALNQQLRGIVKKLTGEDQAFQERPLSMQTSMELQQLELDYQKRVWANAKELAILRKEAAPPSSVYYARQELAIRQSDFYLGSGLNPQDKGFLHYRGIRERFETSQDALIMERNIQQLEDKIHELDRQIQELGREEPSPERINKQLKRRQLNVRRLDLRQKLAQQRLGHLDNMKKAAVAYTQWLKDTLRKTVNPELRALYQGELARVDKDPLKFLTEEMNGLRQQRADDIRNLRREKSAFIAQNEAFKLLQPHFTKDFQNSIAKFNEDLTKEITESGFLTIPEPFKNLTIKETGFAWSDQQKDWTDLTKAAGSSQENPDIMFAQFEERVSTLDADIAGLEGQVSIYSDMISEARAIIATNPPQKTEEALEQNITTWTNRINELEKTIKHHRTALKCAFLDQALEGMSDAHNQWIAIGKGIQAGESRLTRLKEKADTRKAERLGLVEAIATKETEIINIQQRAVAHNQALRDSGKSRDELESQLEVATRNLALHGEGIEKTKEQRESLATKIQEHQKGELDLAALADKIQEIAANISIATGKKEALEKLITDKEAQLEKLRNEAQELANLPNKDTLETLGLLRGRLDKAIAHAEADIEKQKQELLTVQDSVAQLQQQRAETNGQKDSLQAAQEESRVQYHQNVLQLPKVDEALGQMNHVTETMERERDALLILLAPDSSEEMIRQTRTDIEQLRKKIKEVDAKQALDDNTKFETEIALRNLRANATSQQIRKLLIGKNFYSMLKTYISEGIPDDSVARSLLQGHGIDVNLRKAATMGLFTREFARPTEYLDRFELIERGYSWQYGLTQIADNYRTKGPAYLASLGKNFLSFAHRHPEIASTLVGNFTVALDALSGQNAVTRVHDVLKARLYSRGAFGEHLGFSEREPFVEEDFPFLALSDCLRMSPLALHGARSLGIFMDQLQRNGLIQALFVAGVQMTWETAITQFVQAAGDLDAESQNTLNFTLNVATGVPAQDILQEQSQLETVGTLGTMRQALFKPIPVIQRALRSLEIDWQQVKKAKGGERIARIFSTIVLPTALTAGAATFLTFVFITGPIGWALALTYFFACLGGLTTMPTMLNRLIDYFRPETRTAVLKDRARGMIANLPEMGYRERLIASRSTYIRSQREKGYLFHYPISKPGESPWYVERWLATYKNKESNSLVEWMYKDLQKILEEKMKQSKDQKAEVNPRLIMANFDSALNDPRMNWNNAVNALGIPKEQQAEAALHLKTLLIDLFLNESTVARENGIVTQMLDACFEEAFVTAATQNFPTEVEQPQMEITIQNRIADNWNQVLKEVNKFPGQNPEAKKAFLELFIKKYKPQTPPAAR